MKLVVFLFMMVCLWFLMLKRRARPQAVPIITAQAKAFRITALEPGPPSEQNDVGNLLSCIEIIKTTSDIDLFFFNYELGMRTALKLRLAIQSDLLKPQNAGEIVNSFFAAAQSEKHRILADCVSEEFKKIKSLKTDAEKRNQIKTLLDRLAKYESEFDGEFESDYFRTVEFIQNQKLTEE